MDAARTLLVKDTGTRFGVISVALHWYVALTILFLLMTGTGIHFLPVHGPLRPLRQSLTWRHMSFAVTAVPFVFGRIVWRIHYGKPQTHTQHWMFKYIADAVWILLLIMMASQIITGPSRQLSRPEDVQWFGITVIPAKQWMAGNWTEFLRRLHFIGAMTIAGLVTLHIGGALKHFLIDRDGVVQRMLWPVLAKSEVPAESRPVDDAVPAPAAAGS